MQHPSGTILSLMLRPHIYLKNRIFPFIAIVVALVGCGSAAAEQSEATVAANTAATSSDAPNGEDNGFVEQTAATDDSAAQTEPSSDRFFVAPGTDIGQGCQTIRTIDYYGFVDWFVIEVQCGEAPGVATYEMQSGSLNTVLPGRRLGSANQSGFVTIQESTDESNPLNTSTTATYGFVPWGGQTEAWTTAGSACPKPAPSLDLHPTMLFEGCPEHGISRLDLASGSAMWTAMPGKYEKIGFDFLIWVNDAAQGPPAGAESCATPNFTGTVVDLDTGEERLICQVPLETDSKSTIGANDKNVYVVRTEEALWAGDLTAAFSAAESFGQSAFTDEGAAAIIDHGYMQIFDRYGAQVWGTDTDLDGIFTSGKGLGATQAGAFFLASTENGWILLDPSSQRFAPWPDELYGSRSNDPREALVVADPQDLSRALMYVRGRNGIWATEFEPAWQSFS